MLGTDCRSSARAASGLWPQYRYLTARVLKFEGIVRFLACSVLECCVLSCVGPDTSAKGRSHSEVHVLYGVCLFDLKRVSEGSSFSGG